jgi:hypothetical protein
MRRWCPVGCALFVPNARFAPGVAKMMPKLSQMHFANASLENVRFATAGAPFCFETFNFRSVLQHVAPVQKI